MASFFTGLAMFVSIQFQPLAGRIRLSVQNPLLHAQLVPPVPDHDMPRIFCLLIFVLTFVRSFAWAGEAALAAEPDLRAQRRELQHKYHQQLGSLAETCASNNWQREAARTRSWVVPRDPRREYLFLPPVEARSEAASDFNDTWRARFTALRRTHAAGLWDLANRAAGQNDNALAYQLAHEVLHEDPQHAAARSLLGLAQEPPALRVSAGRTRHRTYGWAAGNYRWLRSPHYRVLTNVDEQAARALVEVLETLHAVWRQLFVDFWITDDAFQRGWNNGSLPPGRRGKHRVVYFADRAEYISQLKRWEPQIEVSLGVYRAQQQTAFFYADKPARLATWRHEATHQLFHAATKAGGEVGEASDFWIVEGIALFMESLVQHPSYCAVGGADADRLQFARFRALSAEEYVPLATLAQFGRDRLQSDARIRRLYTQAAGITHFFMQDQEARYRAALGKYLRDVYAGQVKQTLAARTGISFAELDQQYHQYLLVNDRDLHYLAQNPRLRRLSLGHTNITDAGLTGLSRCPDLEWLDLSHCDITDRALGFLPENTPLRQLSLEGTAITNEAAKIIGRCGQLTELDLSATRITDAGLADLAQLSQLTALWLAGTPVTDESIAALSKLRQLEELDVRGTRITAAGRQQLRAALPQLKSLLPGA